MRCFEADVRLPYRYLIDRGIKGSLRIDGEERSAPHVDVLYIDPEIAPADWSPELSVLALDIETDPRASRLLSVSLFGCGAAEVLLLTPPGYECPANAEACVSEPALLTRLAQRIRELDPDVLTGWNVIDFDLAVLARLAERHDVRLAFGRGAEPLKLRRSSLPRQRSLVQLPGRVVLDGLDLVRGSFVRLERYSLEGASREILGRGKTMAGSHRAEQILDSFEHDREGLATYNLEDSRLVIDILEKLGLIELTVQRSRLTGMPPDRVSASIASFDFLYLSELHRRHIVAPSTADRQDDWTETGGGHVLAPLPGLYDHVLVLDFKSLYPSIIRTFQIDPLGRLAEPGRDDEAIVAPNGAAFRREPGILPGLLDSLVPQREAARQRGDSVASQAIKILMNSFYGVLGTSACRFGAPELANAITGFGREILLWTRARVEARGLPVLYGDTDSLFVESKAADSDAALALGRRLVRELNDELAAHIAQTWQCESCLELEFEKSYRRFVLPAMRHGAGGARKRYAGLVDDGAEGHVEFVGMEVVRRDWTELARRTQRELYERLFRGRRVEAYVRDTVAGLRRGEFDDLLVYRKVLRKRLEDYTAQTPPHVAAARKMRGRPGRTVRYLWTTDGPEPEEERRSPVDHEHYVQKQIRPVAEPVLKLLSLEFDRVIGDDRQQRLF